MGSSLISIVLPFYNEEKNLPELYRRLKEVIQGIPHTFEFVFVDDGSTDGSALAVRALAEKNSAVKLVSFSRNFGHQMAITAGLDFAAGDAVITMDSDLQHPPEMIPQLIHIWEQGYDVVYTVREPEKGQPILKKISSALFYRVFKYISPTKLPSNTADFRLVDKKVLKVLRQMRETHRFLRGMISWSGFKSIGISYTPAKRTAGQSKYTWAKMIRLAFDGVISFSTAPLKIAIYTGFLLVAGSFLYFCYILYVRFVTHAVIQGWTSLIIMVLLIGGIQLILMGISGLYIGKIFEEIKGRPLYIVKETIGLKEK